MKLSVAFVAAILLFQTGCSLNLKMFGSQSQSSELPSTSVKGNFPLGEPDYTAAAKYSFSATAGNQFVFVDNTNVIHVLSSAGKPVRTITVPSIHNISALAIDNSGNILITGTYTVNGDAYLMKYSITGSFLSELARFPPIDLGGGNFASKITSHLKVSADGSIFMVSDHITRQIEKYSPTGTLLQVYANTTGLADGQFNGVQNYIPNADGTLYVADMQSNRIQLLNANGSFHSKFTWPQQDPTTYLEGFMRNADGSFVLAERSNTTTYLHKFDATGTPLWMKDGTESGAAYLNWTPSLTKFNGNYYFSVHDILYVYDENGGLVDFYKKTMDHPTAVTRAKDGTFFVADRNGIFKYSATGNLQNTFGPAAMSRVMAVGGNDILYVGEVLNGAAIEKFNLNGVSQGSIAIGAAQTNGICVDKDNNVFVSADSSIYKIAASDESVTVFKSGIYTGMHCNEDGTFYVLFYDGASLMIQKLSAAGAVLQTFDHSGAGAIGITYGLSVSPQGFAIVADTYTSGKIFVFKVSDGSYVRSFGNTGADALLSPFGVFADTYGDIFVADTNNSFVKKVSVTGTLLTE